MPQQNKDPFPVGSARSAPGPQPSRKLFSVPGLLRGRGFEGAFNARGESYQLAFQPTSASVSGRKLVLTGRVAVRGPSGGARSVTARARLAAIQGGIGALGARPQQQGGSDVATSDQKQEQAKAPETSPQPAAPPATAAAVPAPRTASGLPVTQSTGPTAYAGVLYFRFDALDGAALGVPLDLSALQLNARLAPQTDAERSLLWLYSDLVASLAGEAASDAAASRLVEDLNRLLGA